MANDTTKKNSNPTGKKKKATVRNVVNGIIIVFLCCVLLGLSLIHIWYLHQSS